jgi:hypothetical protein
MIVHQSTIPNMFLRIILGPKKLNATGLQHLKRFYRTGVKKVYKEQSGHMIGQQSTIPNLFLCIILGSKEFRAACLRHRKKFYTTGFKKVNHAT